MHPTRTVLPPCCDQSNTVLSLYSHRAVTACATTALSLNVSSNNHNFTGNCTSYSSFKPDHASGQQRKSKGNLLMRAPFEKAVPSLCKIRKDGVLVGEHK